MRRFKTTAMFSVLGTLAAWSASHEATAAMSRQAVVQGRIDNIEELRVQLRLENGTKVWVPRGKLDKEYDLRPGSKIAVIVRLDELVGINESK
jgi:hypothetical protein